MARQALNGSHSWKNQYWTAASCLQGDPEGDQGDFPLLIVEAHVHNGYNGMGEILNVEGHFVSDDLVVLMRKALS